MRFLSLFFLFVAASFANKLVMEAVLSSMKRLKATGFFDRTLERESVLKQPLKCKENKVTIEGEEFPCGAVNFLSYVAMRDLEIVDVLTPHDVTIGATGADIWGWLSPTGREFTLMALDNGVVAIDSTDPVNPCIVAKMPTRRVVDKWADVKVYKDALYHVKDTRFGDESALGLPDYGIEVYDLLPLDQLNCQVDGWVPLNLFPNFVVTDHGKSHNLVINPESGLLYSVGSEKCNEGLMVFDVKTDPLQPTFVSCADSDGYTHDAQCLVYDGPDARYTGKEICFAFNEDTLTIWDLSEVETPVIVSRTEYPNQVYSHQGWVNDDLTKILLDDELDEMCNENMNAHSICTLFPLGDLNGETKTSTVVFDISDLESPIHEGAYLHPDEVVDHNLYVWGTVHRKGWGGNPPMEFHPDPNFAYMNNYLAGLKVVDIRDKDFKNWKQVGYFDVAPDRQEIEFAGAWSGYMHPSGTYALSSIERGLFLLEPTMAFTSDFPRESEDDDDDTNIIAIVLPIVIIILSIIILALFLKYKKPVKEEKESTQISVPPPEKPETVANPMFMEDGDIPKI